jgi:hypothetical protein
MNIARILTIALVLLGVSLAFSRSAWAQQCHYGHHGEVECTSDENAQGDDNSSGNEQQ